MHEDDESYINLGDIGKYETMGTPESSSTPPMHKPYTPEPWKPNPNNTHAAREKIRMSVFVKQANAMLLNPEKDKWTVVICDRQKTHYVTTRNHHPGMAVIEAIDWCDGAQIRIKEWN